MHDVVVADVHGGGAGCCPWCRSRRARRVSVRRSRRTRGRRPRTAARRARSRAGRTPRCPARCRSSSSRRPSRSPAGGPGRWRRAAPRGARRRCGGTGRPVRRDRPRPWRRRRSSCAPVPSRNTVPSPTRTGITDMWMWVIVGRSRTSSHASSSVICSSISWYSRGLPSSRDQLGCVPHFGQVLGNRGDDLLVEVEPQVVAGRPVGEPVVADPDPAADLLVDHGIDHRMLVLQAREVRRRGHPTVEPSVVLATAGLAARRTARRRRRTARRLGARIGPVRRGLRVRWRGGHGLVPSAHPGVGLDWRWRLADARRASGG